MRRTDLLIIAGLILGAAGPSQPPPPGGREAHQPPQQVPEEHPAQPTADQRGAEERPIFVKPILPPKSEKEAAQDAEDRSEKSSADRWMVGLTGAIAIIGAIQAGVFWIQASRLKATIKKMDEIATGQTTDMANSIAQASRAADAMKEVASHMQESAAATQLAAVATQDSVKAMRESEVRQAADFSASIAAAQKAAEAADLSAKAAIGVELPFLQVEKFIASKGADRAFEEWAKGPTIDVTIRNYGRSPAFVHEVVVNLLVAHSAPDIPNYQIHTNIPDSFVITPNEPREYTEYFYSKKPPFTGGQIVDIASGTINLYAYGVVKFQDFMDKSHTRGFMFLYVEKTGNFTQIYWRKHYYYQT